jgi:lipoprotein-anchoring transpeptidase ErfK/SrfK
MAGVLLIGGLAGAGGVHSQTLPPPPPHPLPLSQGGGDKAGGTVGPVAELLIDLSEQRLSAFDSEHRLLYRRLVSTGLPSSPTPSGTFTVASRFATTSLTGRDYRIASVPNVLCLGGGGLNPDAICIHPAPWQEAAGQAFGVRRSHGCVRTSSATARWLFAHTAVGTPVIIRP